MYNKEIESNREEYLRHTKNLIDNAAKRLAEVAKKKKARKVNKDKT